MNRLPGRRAGGPPHNPELAELVRGKRHGTEPLPPTAIQQGFRGWHERGYLPHRDSPGLTQFVTYHLADSFPANARSEWAALLEIEDDLDRRRQLEAYLDRGRGSCALRRPDIAAMVERNLRHFHSVRYEVRAWVIMPNHVHVMVRLTAVPLSKIVHSWKSFTAHQANAVLGRSGSFWQEDYWDTYVRDTSHENRTVRYIEGNPVRAGLVRDPRDWRWSSARIRDQWGVLCFP